MDLGIAGRVAIVCGSTSGLGEGIARALGTEGVRVVISGRRGDRAAQIAAELPEAIGVEVDITAPDAADVLVAKAEEAFGSVDIVVLNGPGPRPTTALQVDEEDLVSAVESLLLPHRRLVERVIGPMRQQKWGRILAVGSSGMVSPIPGLATSNIGRAALAAYLKTLANEVAIDGVTVNILLPGRIDTDRIVQLDTARAEKAGVAINEVISSTLAGIPMQRSGSSDEFGAAGAFLCSEQAAYITGTWLRCDGGKAPFL